MRPRGTRVQRGQSLVEFALTLPLVLLIIFGLVDGARAIYAYNAVSEAARAGARYGAVYGGTYGSANGGFVWCLASKCGAPNGNTPGQVYSQATGKSPADATYQTYNGIPTVVGVVVRQVPTLDPADMAILIECPPEPSSDLCDQFYNVQVSVTYRYRPLVFFFLNGGAGLDISAVAVALRE